MPMFSENAQHQRNATTIGRAVMQLSMADYRVVQCTSRGAQPSIQVDKPFAGGDTETQITQHAEKKFGSCEYCGCRVYWEIPPEKTP